MILKNTPTLHNSHLFVNHFYFSRLFPSIFILSHITSLSFTHATESMANTKVNVILKDAELEDWLEWVEAIKSGAIGLEIKKSQHSNRL
jgi:hypothetical protein